MVEVTITLHGLSIKFQVTTLIPCVCVFSVLDIISMCIFTRGNIRMGLDTHDNDNQKIVHFIPQNHNHTTIVFLMKLHTTLYTCMKYERLGGNCGI